MKEMLLFRTKKRILLFATAIGLLLIILIGSSTDWRLYSAVREESKIGQIVGIRRTNVKSSALLSVGYDKKSSTLEMEFHNHSIYQYYGVPRTVYDELMQASSLGTYFNQRVKGVYRFARVR